mmetsp:Transcript_26857/g.31673  ORF Transcript_26857/g.31673 Transcript_26857/m.31673 type:complete len:91 (+) Transcript_26857:832-1104(+)
MFESFLERLTTAAPTATTLESYLNTMNIQQLKDEIKRKKDSAQIQGADPKYVLGGKKAELIQRIVTLVTTEIDEGMSQRSAYPQDYPWPS